MMVGRSRACGGYSPAHHPLGVALLCLALPTGAGAGDMAIWDTFEASCLAVLEAGQIPDEESLEEGTVEVKTTATGLVSCTLSRDIASDVDPMDFSGLVPDRAGYHEVQFCNDLAAVTFFAKRENMTATARGHGIGVLGFSTRLSAESPTQTLYLTAAETDQPLVRDTCAAQERSSRPSTKGFLDNRERAEA